MDFDGRIVGEDHAACHRLRDGLRGPQANGAVEADEPLRDVLVIGAGGAGLSAALMDPRGDRIEALRAQDGATEPTHVVASLSEIVEIVTGNGPGG